MQPAFGRRCGRRSRLRTMALAIRAARCYPCPAKPLWEGNMKLPRRQFLHLAAGAAALAMPFVGLISDGAWSQATRTIKIVVPFPPGGVLDILARVLAEQIGRAQGTTMIVENRPGAGGVIGTEAVSRATPDGNTLLVNSSSFITIPHLQKLNYDPLTSFE